jgi:hypothetical protein
MDSCQACTGCCRNATEVVDCWMDGPEEVHGEAPKGRRINSVVVWCSVPSSAEDGLLPLLYKATDNQQRPHSARYTKLLTVGSSERFQRTIPIKGGPSSPARAVLCLSCGSQSAKSANTVTASLSQE